MRRTITAEVLRSYPQGAFALSRRRLRTLGFAERMDVERWYKHLHPNTLRTYKELLAKWQSAGMPHRIENTEQRRQRARFYASLANDGPYGRIV